MPLDIGSTPDCCLGDRRKSEQRKDALQRDLSGYRVSQSLSVSPRILAALLYSRKSRVNGSTKSLASQTHAFKTGT